MKGTSKEKKSQDLGFYLLFIYLLIYLFIKFILH